MSLFLIASISTLSQETIAQEISVVEVKRNITLADDDPVYKDYYLNAGDASALRKKMVVLVKRKINIKDASSKSIGNFETVVGQLKIIQIGDKVSVAREHKLMPRDEEAMLEQIGIMSGDRIDLTGSFIDNTKPNNKQKTTEAEPSVKAEDITAKTATTGEVLVSQAPTLAPAAPSAPVRDPANQDNSAPKAQPAIQLPAQLPVQAPVPVPQI